MPFAATWMGLKGIILSEIREKHCMISFICFTKKQNRNCHRTNVATRVERGGGLKKTNDRD